MDNGIDAAAEQTSGTGVMPAHRRGILDGLEAGADGRPWRSDVPVFVLSSRQRVVIRKSNPTTTSAPSETPTRIPRAE
jgi:hypothetical protein